MIEVVETYQSVENPSLEVVYRDGESLDRIIKAGEISRPGLGLTGYFNYYSHDRSQLLGSKKITFAERMMLEEHLLVMRRLCTEDTPAFIVPRRLEIPEELVTVVKENGVSVLRSPISTPRLLGEPSSYLDGRSTARTNVRGVLIDAYGLGVLIQGDSGIGKSETALGLTEYGRQLVADDRVDVCQQDELIVVEEPSKILQHSAEIHSVGIINIVNLPRISVVRGFMQVQLIVYSEAWEKGKKYDRPGSDDAMVEIANVDVPQIRIPVKTGRDVAIIVRVAAVDFHAETVGYDAAKTFEERLTRLTGEDSEGQEGKTW